MVKIMELKEWLKAKQLDDSIVHKQPIVCESGDTVYFIKCCDDCPDGVAKHIVKTFNSIDEYKDSLKGIDKNITVMPDGVLGCHVDGVTGSDAKKLSDQRTEALSYIYADKSLSDEAQAEMHKRYFPLKVFHAAAQDITIKTGSQFIVPAGTGEFHIGTLTIHKGGNFIVKSNANIQIDSIVEAAAN